MQSTIAALMLLGGAAALAGGATLVGEQHVGGSSYALSGFDIVSYFDTAQAPVGEPPTPGRADISAEWNGATWTFAGKENRDDSWRTPKPWKEQQNDRCT